MVQTLLFQLNEAGWAKCPARELWKDRREKITEMFQRTSRKRWYWQRALGNAGILIGRKERVCLDEQRLGRKQQKELVILLKRQF